MKARSAFLFAVLAGPYLLDWSAETGAIRSAAAQVLPSECTETALRGDIDGNVFYRCPDGSNYRLIGGAYVPVDEDGRRLVLDDSNDPGAETDAAASDGPTLPPAQPHFQRAPGAAK